MIKNFTIVFAIAIALCACTQKKEQQAAGVDGSQFHTPEEVVTSLMKAMNARDSAGITNTIATSSKESIIQKINSLGGFKVMFGTMEGIRFDMKISGVDSSSAEFAKVYTDQSIMKDTMIIMHMDSLYFPVVKENGGWKMKSLNAQPGKKYQITGAPAK
jgi:hypothetical protein